MLEPPPKIVEPLLDTVFPLPPAIVALNPDAILRHPPPTVEPLLDAVFLYPPEIVV